MAEADWRWAEKRAAPDRSGRNIGKKTVPDTGNLVLELQLAFFSRVNCNWSKCAEPEIAASLYRDRRALPKLT